MEPLRVTRHLKDLPSRLLNSEQASQILADKGINVPPGRLSELAESLLAPHYRVDGGEPLFQPAEIRQWVAANLTAKVDGESLPVHLRVIDFRGVDLASCPPSLGQIADRLVRITPCSCSGVYFLCSAGEVVYVGQSVNVGGRIHEHARNKHFDAVFALPCPESELDAVEGAFIRMLRPRLNVQGTAGDGLPDSETLASIGINGSRI